MKRAVLTIAAAGVIAGCATGDHHGSAPHAAADLNSAQGAKLAEAHAYAVNGGVRIFIEAEGLPPGTYAAHVHTTGSCEAPGFTSAGGHWDPAGRQHGMENPAGPHHGDLPNLTVSAAREGTIAFVIRGAELTTGAAPLLDADGAAVVIHQRADDHRTDPSGNSGDRIACGVLVIRAADQSQHKAGEAH